MSAPAAAPVLALLPPGDPPLLPAHAPDREVLRQKVQKVRRVTTAGCVIGAFTPVAFTAAGPYLGDAVFVGLVIPWALVIPGCGLALLLSAAITRTRDDLKALLAVFLSLVLAIALIEPAARAGMEAFVASHATELDVLTAERARLLDFGETPDASVVRSGAEDANSAALRRMGVTGWSYVNGGLRLRTAAPFAPDLLYADGGGDSISACNRLSVTPLGGRWFLYECRDASEYHDM
ncbi:MAG TPA: hypothetical protein VGB15_03070 [Longimicrobium sp.]